MIYVIPTGSNIEFTAIQSPKLDCGPKACEDCNCGKAEKLKGESK
jgi:hypothetical protein